MKYIKLIGYDKKMRRKSHEDFVSELKLLNPYITVMGVYENSSTKIEVSCNKCNHIWYVTPNSLLQGSGCPKCANNQKKTNEDFIQEMKEYNPYIEVVGEYINAHTPLKVRCKICNHEWMCKPMRLLHGAQCQNCVRPHTSFMEQFILLSFRHALGEDEVESRNIEAVGLELDIYIPKYHLAIEPGTWLYHSTKVNKSDLQKRQACGESGIKLITIYDTYPKNTPAPFKNDCYVYDGFLNEIGYVRIINLVKKLMLDISVDYSFLDWQQIANEAYANCHYNAHENFIQAIYKIDPNIEVLEEYKGSHIPISVNNKTCEHPAWKARPETLLKGIGCPLCGRQTAAKSRTRTTEEFIIQLQDISPQINVIGEYTKVTDRISVQCKECGKEWSPLAYSLLSGKGCPHCSAKKGASHRTNRLARKSTEEFIDELKAINPNIVILGEYVNNKTKIAAKCLLCNFQWEVVPASLLHGHGCPKCGRKKA